MKTLDFLKNHAYTSGCLVRQEELTSVDKIIIYNPETELYVYIVLRNSFDLSLKYCTLITDDFTLKLSYNDTHLKILDRKGDLLNTIDSSIEEGHFFQKSCVENYSTVCYEDIQILKDILSTDLGD